MSGSKKTEVNSNMGHLDHNKTNASDTDVIDTGKVQERLGIGLRSMYRSVLEEPLPDDMLALLDQLDDSDEADQLD